MICNMYFVIGYSSIDRGINDSIQQHPQVVSTHMVVCYMLLNQRVDPFVCCLQRFNGIF